MTVWYRCYGRPREITRWEGSYLGLNCQDRPWRRYSVRLPTAPSSAPSPFRGGGVATVT
jgi:hypothetical protein